MDNAGEGRIHVGTRILFLFSDIAIYVVHKLVLIKKVIVFAR